MEQSLSFGIDPAGIGTTGIVVKANGKQYSHHAQLVAKNPVEAFDFIVSWIDEQKRISKINQTNFIAVELNHGGEEKRKEVKATRELIGMIRSRYRRLFKGHLPNDKNRESKKLKEKKFGKSHSHWIDAEEILYAHIQEKERGLKCQDWRWETHGGNQKN